MSFRPQPLHECRCMSLRIFSLPHNLSWWIDFTKRQAYVQVSLLAKTRIVMSDRSQNTPPIPSMSSRSSMLMDFWIGWKNPTTNFQMGIEFPSGCQQLTWVSIVFALYFLFFCFAFFNMMIYSIITTVNIRNLHWWPPPVTGHIIWYFFVSRIHLSVATCWIWH
jgi:hypothetical protein